MPIPLEKYKPIGAPSISERGLVDPPVSFRKSWVPAIWQVKQERRNRRELWIIVVTFSIATVLSLLSESAAIVAAPVAVAIVTLILGYAAFGRGKRVSVVPRHEKPRE